MSTYKKICITNRHLAGENLLRQIENVCKMDQALRPDLIILREKDLTEPEYLALAENVMKIVDNFPEDKPLLILHTFKNASRQLDCPRIHLTMQDFVNLTDEERAYFQVIGVSTHSVEEAVLAQKQGASYITASHIFETKCKEGLAPRGLEYLRDVCQTVHIPVYALGGIHPENIGLCIQAGADGICMMSEYMRGDKANG